MADDVKATNRDDVSLSEKLDDLYELIDGIEVAMLTTRRPDGHLVSRAMQTQERRGASELWFVTNVHSHKLDELANDPHVNLAYYRDRTREWVSVSGTASVSQDRTRIHELYDASWKPWFPEEGGANDGSADDPRMALVLVKPHAVVYTKKDRPMPMVLFELGKAMLTGDAPDVADVRQVSEGELRQGDARA